MGCKKRISPEKRKTKSSYCGTLGLSFCRHTNAPFPVCLQCVLQVLSITFLCLRRFRNHLCIQVKENSLEGFIISYIGGINCNYLIILLAFVKPIFRNLFFD